jgi:pimeloyl-ACP methyl ester carboxylesterase
MPTNRFNLKVPTLGGMQFWTDYRNIFGYRLQQNAFTKRWRVLDSKNVRWAWGDRNECCEEFERMVSSVAVKPSIERLIVLLHGLMRTPRSMRGLGEFLATTLDAPVVLPTYASTQGSVSEHACAFREVLESLPEASRIDLVAHSMGNIVIRHAIADWQRQGDPRGVLKRLHRMVMLGPPNQGALIARRLSRTGMFGLITGRGGLELGPAWERLEPNLAVPPFPFAIVAGKVSGPLGKNPLVDGASDFVVAVEETRLDGASQSIEVESLHSFLMDSEEVQRFTLGFFSEV